MKHGRYVIDLAGKRPRGHGINQGDYFIGGLAAARASC